MEARTKIIAAVAVIMMCAAGLVGAGYAYTASTVNSDNNAGYEYVTLTQAADKYTFVSDGKVYFSDINTAADANKYILMNGETTSEKAPSLGITYSGDTLYGALLGQTSTLKATFSSSSADDKPVAYPITISNSGTVASATGWYTVIVFDDSTTKQYALYNSGWHYYTSAGAEIPCIVLEQDSTNAYSKTYTTGVYYCGTDAGTDGYASSTTAPATSPLDDVDLTFTYNHGSNIDQSATTLTSVSPLTLTVTPGTDYSSPTLTWTSTKSAVASVTSAGVVTAASDGITYVICKITEDAKADSFAICKITVSLT